MEENSGVVFNVDERRAGTSESVAEDVLQNGHKVNKLRKRVVYCLGTAAVKQGLH